MGDQATFALSVIAYRAGVTGFERPVPDETHIRAIPGDEEMLFSINQSDPSDADFDLLSRLSSGELYGIRPDREATTAIDCGDDHLLLCLDADVQSAVPDTLLQALRSPIRAAQGLMALRPRA